MSSSVRLMGKFMFNSNSFMRNIRINGSNMQAVEHIKKPKWPDICVTQCLYNYDINTLCNLLHSYLPSELKLFSDLTWN